MNQKTSKVEKEFYLRCSYLTLSVLFDKEPILFSAINILQTILLDWFEAHGWQSSFSDWLKK